MKKLEKVFLILSCLAVLGACGDNRHSTEWREAVQLSNGELITVKRTAGGKSVSELGGPGRIKGLQMSLSVEGSKTAAPPPQFVHALNLMIIDYDSKNSEWFVLATFGSCDVWQAVGRPNLPYLEFRARGGQWERVELSEEVMKRESNLLVTVNLDGEESFVGIAEKEKRNASAWGGYLRVMLNRQSINNQRC